MAALWLMLHGHTLSFLLLILSHSSPKDYYSVCELSHMTKTSEDTFGMMSGTANVNTKYYTYTRSGQNDFNMIIFTYSFSYLTPL